MLPSHQKHFHFFCKNREEIRRRGKANPLPKLVVTYHTKGKNKLKFHFRDLIKNTWRETASFLCFLNVIKSGEEIEAWTVSLSRRKLLKTIVVNDYKVDHWAKPGRGVLTPYGQKSAYKFWLSQNVTTNSLLLPGSLTDSISSWLTHILYVPCIIHCICTTK